MHNQAIARRDAFPRSDSSRLKVGLPPDTATLTTWTTSQAMTIAIAFRAYTAGATESAPATLISGFTASFSPAMLGCTPTLSTARTRFSRGAGARTAWENAGSARLSSRALVPNPCPAACTLRVACRRRTSGRASKPAVKNKRGRTT